MVSFVSCEIAVVVRSKSLLHRRLPWLSWAPLSKLCVIFNKKSDPTTTLQQKFNKQQKFPKLFPDQIGLI